jgi:hypothetical protein
MESPNHKLPLATIIAWLLPIWGYCAYFCYDLITTGAKYSRLVLLMSIGESLLILTALLLGSVFVVKLSGMQILIAFANIAGLIFILYSIIITQFAKYHLAFGFMIWTFVFSILALKKNIPGMKKRMKDMWTNKKMYNFTRFGHKIKENVVTLILIALVLISGILFISTPNWNLQTQKFTITDEQAQETDIVFYYASGTNGYIGKEGLLDVCVDNNVTLSLAWHIDYYNDTVPNTLGYEMANFSRNANAKGVKLEFFPCFHFNWEGILEGYFFKNVNLTLDWYEYWTYFKNWTKRESIDVDYILWDIEGGTIPSDVLDLNTHDQLNDRMVGSAQRERELPLIRAEFESILDETQIMGAITRITTWDPLDALDGDHDIQLFGGQIGYVFEDLIENETIEYVSSMSYTNRWGDAHPDIIMGRERVYENARIARSIHPNNTGICIGNINGNGLTTIEEVVGEYRLAVAGGATSVRLFNGASWVLGWDYKVKGPEWGVNGTRALFEQCRKGGTAQFTENKNATYYQFGYLNADIGQNFFKI